MNEDEIEDNWYNEIIAFKLTRKEIINLMRSNESITESLKQAQQMYLKRLNPLQRFAIKVFGGLT